MPVAPWAGQALAMLELRALDPDDWRLWRELRLAALADAPEAFGSVLADWQGPGDREERWRSRLSIPGGCSFVVLLDGRGVGMVSAVPGDDAGTVELISMWVSPTARGRGVGDLLIRAAEQWAVGRGAGTLRLAVMPDKGGAIALYERNGFVSTGEVGNLHPAGRGREAVMAKRLVAG